MRGVWLTLLLALGCDATQLAAPIPRRPAPRFEAAPLPASTLRCRSAPGYEVSSSGGTYAVAPRALVVPKQHQLLLTARHDDGEEAFRIRLGDARQRTTTRGVARWGLGYAALVLGSRAGATVVLVDQNGARAGEIAFAADAAIDDGAIAVDGARAWVLLRLGTTLRMTELDLEQRTVAGHHPAGDATTESTLRVLPGGAGLVRPSPDAPLRGFPADAPEESIDAPGPLVALAAGSSPALRPFFTLPDREGLFTLTDGSPSRVVAPYHGLALEVVPSPDGPVVAYREGADVLITRLSTDATPSSDQPERAPPAPSEPVVLGPVDGRFDLTVERSASRPTALRVELVDHDERTVRARVFLCE